LREWGYSAGVFLEDGLLREGPGSELIATIGDSSRAIVFISVPWSGPERIARQLFRIAVDRIERDFSELGVSNFRLEVDEDEESHRWLSSIGYLPWAIAGVGSLLWLKSGKAISSEISASAIGVDGIIERSNSIW
jgi:hypothetical protein